MYDFLNFIEDLVKYPRMEDIKPAIAKLEDYFHIGKIVIKSKDNLETYTYSFDDNLIEEPYITFSHNNYDYLFYKKNDNYNFTERENKELLYVLRYLEIHHYISMMNSIAEKGQFISANTKLPNIHGFMKKVNELIGRIDYKKYNSYFINIKGFGLVNNLFGTEQADKAIIQYANRLEAFANDDEIIGHLGGDNFIALIKRDRHEKFVNIVTMCPINIEKDGLKKTVNLIGVLGYYEIETQNPDYGDLISNASMACQYARSNKKIIVKLTPEISDMLISAKKIENTFKDELEKGNFVVYYQPKFDIKSGKIIGVEALSRWISKGNVVPPGVFVPILERNGEIVNLDLFVLNNLCSDIHNYRNQGFRIVPASCNLSRRDFEDPNLEEKVINIIKNYNVRTEDIVIEVTETTNLEEKERLARFINTMNENGILTSIDDFGTGYSSLSVLRDFMVSEIKIDRSFINREELNDSDEIIIGSIIDMAKRLNIDVICEGVETKAQAEFLIGLGCNHAQGYLYSKPVPKLEFEAMMQRIGTVWD